MVTIESGLHPVGEHHLGVETDEGHRASQENLALTLVAGRTLGTLVRVCRWNGRTLVVQGEACARVMALEGDGFAQVLPLERETPTGSSLQRWNSLKRRLRLLKGVSGARGWRVLRRILIEDNLDLLAEWLCSAVFEIDDDNEIVFDCSQTYLELPSLSAQLEFLHRLVPKARQRLVVERKEELTDDMSTTLGDLYQASARTYLDVRQHLVWRRVFEECEHGVLPNSEPRSNPVVWGNLVVVACFSPGFVRAVDAGTGRTRWTRPLQALGGKPPLVTSEFVLVQDSSTLSALSPRSGRVAWTLTPLEGGGEGMYSSVVEADGRVFVGDRSGRLHCVRLHSGKREWSKQTSPKSYDLNSAPLLVGSSVITANNEGLLTSFRQVDGHRLWRSSLNVSYGGQSLGLYQGQLVVHVDDGLALYDPNSGERLATFEVAEHKVERFCVAGDLLLTEWAGPDQSHLLVAYQGRELYYRRPAARMGIKLAWDPSSSLVWEMRIDGSALLDPASGERVAGLLPRSAGEGAAHVAIAGDRYYLWNGDGELFCLQGPARSWL